MLTCSAQFDVEWNPKGEGSRDPSCLYSELTNRVQSLKWKQRQNAHSNGPWHLIEHKHWFWVKISQKRITYKSNFDRKKIRFLEGRQLIIITKSSRYKVDSKNSLSDSALNYRDQLTSSFIVVPVADWLWIGEYTYFPHICHLGLLCEFVPSATN